MIKYYRKSLECPGKYIRVFHVLIEIQEFICYYKTNSLNNYKSRGLKRVRKNSAIKS